MDEQAAVERAELVAQMAPHSSVTTAVLAGQETQFSDSRLVGDPPVAYLERSEAPAYVLTEAKRGIALGTKRNQISPDDGRGTIILVTGRRTLCLVGARPNDEVVEIPHDAVASVSYHTGLLANRLEIQTAERTYHCWVGRQTDESVLRETVTYVADRINETTTESPTGGDESDDEQSDRSYRGEPVREKGTVNDPVSSQGVADEDDDKEQVMYRGQPVDPSFFE